MLEYQYMEPNYSVTNIQAFDGVNGLTEVSNYIDFGIKKTIHKQIPNITPEAESYYAKIILKNYMRGDATSFTSQYGIRSNIRLIGQDKVKYLLIKNLIEKHEYNQRVLHKLVPETFGDECAAYITTVACQGNLDQNEDWIMANIDAFIDEYVDDTYGLPRESKDQREMMCYQNPQSTLALNKLNLEMSLNRFKY